MVTLFAIYLIANFMQAFYKCEKSHNQLQIKALHAMQRSLPDRQPDRLLQIHNSSFFQKSECTLYLALIFTITTPWLGTYALNAPLTVAKSFFNQRSRTDASPSIPNSESFTVICSVLR